jgi:hypothetical protein
MHLLSRKGVQMHQFKKTKGVAPLKYYLARTEMSVIDNIAMDPRLHLFPLHAFTVLRDFSGVATSRQRKTERFYTPSIVSVVCAAPQLQIFDIDNF